MLRQVAHSVLSHAVTRHREVLEMSRMMTSQEKTS